MHYWCTLCVSNLVWSDSHTKRKNACHKDYGLAKTHSSYSSKSAQNPRQRFIYPAFARHWLAVSVPTYFLSIVRNSIFGHFWISDIRTMGWVMKPMVNVIGCSQSTSPCQQIHVTVRRKWPPREEAHPTNYPDTRQHLPLPTHNLWRGVTIWFSTFIY